MYLIFIYSYFRDVIFFLFIFMDGERYFLYINRNKMFLVNLEFFIMNITLLYFFFYFLSFTVKELGEIWFG